MAKRNRRGGSPPKPNRRATKKSTPRAEKKAPAAQRVALRSKPAQQPEPSTADKRSRTEVPAAAPRSSVVGTKLQADSVQSAGERGQQPRSESTLPTASAAAIGSRLAGAPRLLLGTGRRVRTPTPRTIPQAPTEADTLPQQRLSRDSPAQRLGAVRRIRTPTPLAIPGEVEEIKMGGRRPRGERGKVAEKRKEKAEQFRNIQDILQNPGSFNLRYREMPASSTPEEIELRQGEVRYQIKLVQAVLATLTDELAELDHARTQATPDQAAPVQA